MRTTLMMLCLLGLLAGCERAGDREAGAELDRPRTDTMAATGEAGDTAAAGGLKWGPPPPGLPAGARGAILDGDPSKPGPYTVQFDMPAGYEVRPHTHPTGEQIKVLEGTVLLGMGKKWDDAALKPLATGQEASVGAKEPHFVRAKERTVLEIRSTGPFEITYVNPADDPRKAPAQ